MSTSANVIKKVLSSRTFTVSSAALPSSNGRSLLVPSKLTGVEGINTEMRYELELRTDLSLGFGRGSHNISLDGMVGREISMFIELDGKGSAFNYGMARVGAGVR